MMSRVWDFHLHMVTDYERVGECNRCGECCQVPIKYQKAHSKRELYRVEGLQRDIPRCQMFSETGCQAYDQRPLVCQMFPLAPLDKRWFPNCSYEFKVVRANWFESKVKTGIVIELIP